MCHVSFNSTGPSVSISLDFASNSSARSMTLSRSPWTTFSFRLTSSYLWFAAVAICCASSNSASDASSFCSAANERASAARRPSSFLAEDASSAAVFAMLSWSFALFLAASSSRRANLLLRAPICSSASIASLSAISSLSDVSLNWKSLTVCPWIWFVIDPEWSFYLGVWHSNIKLIFNFGDSNLDFIDFPFEIASSGIEFL